MLRRDLPQVLAIENDSFEHPWSEDDFLLMMKQRYVKGMVCEYIDQKNESVCGFVIYELMVQELHVLNFVVAPWLRFSGVGRTMAEKLINKLPQQERQSIMLEVREGNLGAQLFWKKMGFEANGVYRNHYDYTDEDAYRFEYALKTQRSEQSES